MAEGFAIYRRLVGARVRAQLQYRLSFALTVAGNMLISVLDFAAILVLFHQVDALGDWTVGEVALLYGISSVSFALTDVAIGQLDRLPRMIREGEFDQILIRPLSSLLQVFVADVQLRHLGKLTQGFAVLAFALVAADIEWSVARGAWLVVSILAGCAIFSGIWISFATIAFWLIDSLEVANAFTYGGNFTAIYPINIFGSWLRRLVIFLVPVAFVAYFPALFLLDKDDPLDLPRVLQFASPFVGAAALAVGVAVWRVAVRHYRSVGA